MESSIRYAQCVSQEISYNESIENSRRNAVAPEGLQFGVLEHGPLGWDMVMDNP